MLRPSPLSRVCLLIAIAFALTVGLPRAHAWLPHPHKEAKQQIEELEQQWRVATLAADVPAMDRLLSDDYVGISWNGQVNTKAMQLDRTRSRSFALTRMDLSDAKVKIVGHVAIVTARAELEGTTDGADLKGTFRYTRVYQKLPSGAWKITNFEATRVPEPGDHPRTAITRSRQKLKQQTRHRSAGVRYCLDLGCFVPNAGEFGSTQFAPSGDLPFHDGWSLHACPVDVQCEQTPLQGARHSSHPCIFRLLWQTGKPAL